MRRIKEIEVSKGNPLQIDHVNQISASNCFNCQSPTHCIEGCQLIPNPMVGNHEQQLNVVYHRQMNDPYTPTYNPGWRNHPNFSWSQGAYQGDASNNATQPSGS